MKKMTCLNCHQKYNSYLVISHRKKKEPKICENCRKIEMQNNRVSGFVNLKGPAKDKSACKRCNEIFYRQYKGQAYCSFCIEEAKNFEKHKS